MTLQQTIDSIDATYPVAGQDNDSQGFRDNFSLIKQSLTDANAKVIDLQQKAVLTATTSDNANPNIAVTNDLGGSSITNGTFNRFYPSAYTPSAALTQSTDIDLHNGAFQGFVLGADTQFTFRNWPSTTSGTATGQVATVRIFLTSDSTTARTVTFNAYQGTIVYGNSGINTTGWPATFTVPARYIRPTTVAASANATSITIGDVSNLQIGTKVTYTRNDITGTINTTIAGVNATTGTVTLSNAVVTGGILQGQNITFTYNGPRVIEAFSFDGGATVYLSQVADF